MNMTYTAFTWLLEIWTQVRPHACTTSTIVTEPSSCPGIVFWNGIGLKWLKSIVVVYVCSFGTWEVFFFFFFFNMDSFCYMKTSKAQTHMPHHQGVLRTLDSPFLSSYLYPSYKNGAVRMYKDIRSSRLLLYKHLKWSWQEGAKST